MKSKYLEYGGKLAVVCAIAMFGVAGAYVMAKDRIAAGEQEMFFGAIREVLGVEASAGEPEGMIEGASREEQVYKAEIDGEMRYAAQGSQNGFSGPVVIAVGARMVDGDLKIIEARVIKQTETPGLGTRIAGKETNLTLWSSVGNALGGDTKEETDWFFLKKYRGKGIGNLIVTGDPAEADTKIVKITGVTVTSTAATLAVKKALTKISETLGKTN